MHASRLQRSALVFLVLSLGCNKSEASTAAPDDATGAGADEADLDDASQPDESDAEDEAPEQPVLTLTTFEETVQANMQDVLDCFGDAGVSSGKLVADFKIDGEGSVTEVVASGSSTVKKEEVLACIRDKANGWQLPPPPGGNATNMQFPFELG